MRTLDSERLSIRAFVLEDGDTYSRLLDAAFGGDSYGSSDSKRVMFEFQVASDAGLALLHQPPYGDRAIVLRTTGKIIGSVGFAPALAPFGLLPSFESSPHFTPEVGLFWPSFPIRRATAMRPRPLRRWSRTRSPSCGFAASSRRLSTTTRDR